MNDKLDELDPPYNVNWVLACDRAAELFKWFAQFNPPLGGKQAIEMMVVATAVTLHASRPGDKKWAKKGAKIIAELICEHIDYLNLPK